jgi:hypothetical protein
MFIPFCFLTKCYPHIFDKLLSLSRLFADDTSLGYASQDKVINHDLHELGDLPFNPDKTEIMLFKNVFTTFWCLQYK